MCPETNRSYVPQENQPYSTKPMIHWRQTNKWRGKKKSGISLQSPSQPYRSTGEPENPTTLLALVSIPRLELDPRLRRYSPGPWRRGSGPPRWGSSQRTPPPEKRSGFLGVEDSRLGGLVGIHVERTGSHGGSPAKRHAQMSLRQCGYPFRGLKLETIILLVGRHEEKEGHKNRNFYIPFG